MNNLINRYQNAFNKSVEKLRNNEKVLSIFVFGSMVTGDLWEESDVDLLVIVDNDDKRMKNIYSIENNIDVHIRVLSKTRFLEVYEKKIEGGYIHRLLCSSKLVYSKNNEITEIYDRCRLIPDIYRKMWNMVFMGRLIKHINEVKKYISKGNIYTASVILHKSIEEYSKLFVSICGYAISKDVVKMASNLNDALNFHLNNMYNNDGNITEKINDMISYIENEIDANIERVSIVLLKILEENKEPLSSEDIREREDFKEYEIHLEGILDRLYGLQKINRCERVLFKGKNEIKEKVYYM